MDTLDGRDVSYIKFEKGKYPKKYKAKIYDTSDKKIRTVEFGDQRYQQYYDKIGMYDNLNHLNRKRRKEYRSRHGNIITKDGKKAYKIPYTPAFFSYYLLW
jgi:hypothetical protein